MTGIAGFLARRKPSARHPRDGGSPALRTWYRKASDGTFFRNCPLIMAELEQTTDPLADALLRVEWGECFLDGVVVATEIGPGDRWIEYDDSPEANARWVKEILAGRGIEDGGER